MMSKALIPLRTHAVELIFVLSCCHSSKSLAIRIKLGVSYRRIKIDLRLLADDIIDGLMVKHSS